MKYLKLNSLTWWAGFVPLLAGLTIVFEPYHGWPEVVDLINHATGDQSPAVLINAGLMAIGLRGAI